MSITAVLTAKSFVSVSALYLISGLGKMEGCVVSHAQILGEDMRRSPLDWDLICTVWEVVMHSTCL